MASDATTRTTGTVYEGPALTIENPWVNRNVATTTAKAETVYNGPSPTETVFDETKFVAKKANNTVAVHATRRRARLNSIRFFVIAGISLMEAFVWASRDLTGLAIASGVVALLFGVLAVFAFRMNKTAFLIGALIYAANAVFLLTQWNPLALYAMFVRGLVAWRLYCMYGLLSELDSE